MLNLRRAHSVWHPSSPLRLRCSPSLRRPLSTAPRRDPFRVLFFGADRFSCTVLSTLSKVEKELVADIVVVTPPPSRKDKGLKSVYTPPLHLLARELSLTAISLPQEGLRNWVPPPQFASPSPSTLLITASFGHLIPTSLLARFNDLHALNVHPSLLPRYRGAAPIQWSIVNGDTESGVTVQELSRGSFDKGRLLAQSSARVPVDAEYLTLETTLANQSAELLVQVLKTWDAVKANPSTQDSAQATLAPKLTKEHGRIDWASSSALQLDRLRRGISHQIPLSTTLSAKAPPIQVQLAPFPRQAEMESRYSDTYLATPPGTAFYDKKHRFIVVRTAGQGADGLAAIDHVKPAGKHWTAAGEWWNGVAHRDGKVSFV